jgi:hypothetical protein
VVAQLRGVDIQTAVGNFLQTESDFSVIGTQVHDTNACFLKMILLFKNVEETEIYRLGIANFRVSIHVKPFEK